MIVLLECNTVGFLDKNSVIGEIATVSLHDENGHKIEKIGKIIEIL
jgi:hypothetical protein